MRTNITLCALLVAGCNTASIDLDKNPTNGTGTTQTTITKTVTIPATIDLMIKEGDPEGNYEYWPIALGADYDGAERGLFYFDVIPYAGATVLSATMRMYAISPVCQSATTGRCTDSDGNPYTVTVRLYRNTSSGILDPFSVTWNEQPEYDESVIYSTNVIDHTQKDLDAGATEENHDKVKGAVSYDFPLDVAVPQEWINTRTNYGLLLRVTDIQEAGGNSQLDFIVGTSDGKNTVAAPAELIMEIEQPLSPTNS